MKRAYSLIPVFVLCSLQLFSQEKPSRNNLDEMYAPKGSIFQQGKAPSREVSGSREDISYVLKFMPVDIFRGNLVLENEWNLPGTSVNFLFGLGYHSFQGIFERDGTELVLDSETGSGLTVEDAILYGAYNKGGLFYSLGAKFYGNAGWYYNSDATPFYGIYSCIKYEHYKYSYLLNSSIRGVPVAGTRDYNITSNVIRWGLGFSGVTRGKIKTYHDIFIGVAANIRTYSMYEEQVVYTSNSYGYNQPTNLAVNGKGHQVNFIFDFGYCIGLAFK